MIEEKSISQGIRLYESFLDNYSSDNFSDNISSIKLNKVSYLCLKCNKFLNIIFLNKITIKYTCGCKKDPETKFIEDFDYHKLGEKEVSSLTCRKHNKKKFDFYCFNCGENLCPECQKIGHKHNNIKKLNDIQNIGKKIDKLENELFQRNNQSQNDIQSNSSFYDISFDVRKERLFYLKKNEGKFIRFCNDAIKYFKGYSTYSQIENLNKIYEYVFSLKLIYNFKPGSNILFGVEFYKRNKNKFILKNNEKEIEDNNISFEKETTLEMIFIIREGEKLDNLSYMFCQVSSILSIQDIHFLDDSNVKDINKMDLIFYNCTSFKDLYPSKWNSCNFKRNMIDKCSVFKTLYKNDEENFSNENICNLVKNIRALWSKNTELLLSPNSDELNKETEKYNYFIKHYSFKIIFIIFVLFILIIKVKNDDTPVIVKNEIWKGYEIGVGAHYFAITPLRDDYSGITGDIKLPISLNTNKGERIPYISFGVMGLIGRINIGIILFNYGCTPFYYDNKYKKMEGFQDYNCPEETEIVKFKLELLNSSKILFSLKYFDSNSVFLNSFATEIDIRHILVIRNNKSKLRFYRYVQLRPEKFDNQYDGTYMKKGELKELYIIRKNKSESWGIMGRNVEVAWKVSSKHIKLHFNRNKEIFSINHN